MEELDETETIPIEFFRVELMDDMIGQFFEQYKLQLLLKDVQKFNSKVVVLYKFKNNTYEGVLCNCRSGFPETKNQLTIRLSHENGFRYSKLESTYIAAEVKNRNYGGWTTGSFLEKMKNLTQVAKELEATVKLLYNVKGRRTDIEFRSKISLDVVLELCFERGFPKCETKDYFVDLRK